MAPSTVANKIAILFRTGVCILLALSFTPLSYGGEAVSYGMPSAVDSSSKYLFFLHNYYVEINGPDGVCKYYDILQAFADKGFTVISEVRSGEIVPSEYAKKVVSQVKSLLDIGVPPENITIAGHSKGAVITLWVAAQMGNPKINFVVMAGCEIMPLARAYPDFTQLKGNFLSIYALSDTVANSCRKVFSKAIIGLSSKEIKLDSGKGHRLFFQPEEVWLEPVINWLKQGQ